MTSTDSIGIGTVIGEFVIERELGKGGMGVVYKAHEPSLNRKVALKVLSKMLSTDEEFISRFKKEAQIIAALRHPNIVGVLTFGQELGHYYFAMDYIKGTDLGKILQQRTVIPLDQALTITRQIADALSEAGAKGVVHRDLKPSNIMIDEMNQVRVTDFGVARVEESTDHLTKTGMFLGTPEYASPEQASGKPVDSRSDIYALGALLYRMLSGKPPIIGDSPLAVVAKIATEPVTPIGLVNTSVPKPVCDLIGKMMAREVEDRFQTAQEIIVAIDQYQQEKKGAVPAGARSAAGKGAGEKKSHGLLWGGIAILVILLLTGLYVGRGWLFAPQEKDSAEVAPIDVAGGDMPVDEAMPAPVVGDGGGERVAGSQVRPGAAISSETMPASSAITKVPVSGPLPEKPTVLLLVSGVEDLTFILRSELETALLDRDLRVLSPAEIPMLREKMQMGAMPINWYDIQRIVPAGKGHILLLASIQKVGSTMLQYFGQSQEQITATYSLRTLDMATGSVVTGAKTGQVKYTSINMQENVTDSVTSISGNLGWEIEEYWQGKLADKQSK